MHNLTHAHRVWTRPGIGTVHLCGWRWVGPVRVCFVPAGSDTMLQVRRELLSDLISAPDAASAMVVARRGAVPWPRLH